MGKRKILKDKIEVTSYVPFILSGQYGDLEEGAIVSFLTNELSLTSRLKIFGREKFKVKINGKNEVFKFSDLKNNQKGTLKSLLYGVYNLLDSNVRIEQFYGFILEVNTNITTGWELNLLVNIFKSINIIYDLHYDDFALARLVFEVYNKYFGKVYPLLNIMSYFQKEVTHMVLGNNHLTIETAENAFDRYGFMMFEDGIPQSFEQQNIIFNSEYAILNKLKTYFNKKLSEISLNELFMYIYSPNSVFNDSEKLVITHFYEETKRTRQILESFKDKQVTTKLFDGMNMSFVELGAYLGFNKFNKFLEASVIKATFKKQCALSLLNEQSFNKFVFTTLKEDTHEIFEYLKTYKVFNIKSLSINKEGIQIYQIL